MKLRTFKGGVHPYEGKELTEHKPIRLLMPVGELVYPLSQHIGAPAKALVAKGDTVLVGQRIGEAGGFISSHIVSGVSGTVKAVEPRRMVNGAKAMSIVVENDGEFRTVEGYGASRDAAAMTKEEIRAAIKDAGIVGLGGAGFPTHVKLTPKDDTKIDYVLVNGAECEPYLTSDYRLMLEEPEALVKGLGIMLRLFENAKGVIGIEDNKPEAIEKLTKLVQGDPKITVQPLKTKYPQGGERTLIAAITGRRLNSSLLPADMGVVVDNVATVVSIYHAVAQSIPLVERVLTITGDAVADPCNFRVRTGTCYKELVEAAGGFKEEPQKLISGGPMMGQALFGLDLPVTKTSSSLTCFTKDEVAAYTPSACIRCGRCLSVCSCRLVPQKMMDAAERGDLELFEKYEGMECVECGTCAYACPARRPLTQAFKEAKVAVRNAKAAKAAAEKAKAEAEKAKAEADKA